LFKDTAFLYLLCCLDTLPDDLFHRDISPMIFVYLLCTDRKDIFYLSILVQPPEKTILIYRSGRPFFHKIDLFLYTSCCLDDPLPQLFHKCFIIIIFIHILFLPYSSLLRRDRSLSLLFFLYFMPP